MRKSLKINVRRDSELARRSGAVTSTDTYERADYVAGRGREFRDAITRASSTPLPGVPTHAMAWNRWGN